MSDEERAAQLAAAYKEYKERLHALEQQQQDLLREAMHVFQEDKMQSARLKLEQMLK